MTKWRTKGNTAVITGGASGLGLEAARRYAAEGMNLAIIDRNEETLAAAQEELRSIAASDAKVASYKCDVSDLAQVEEVRDAIAAELGNIHCLMNNAGAGLPVGAPWENRAELAATLSINLWGVINGCHAFIPQMLEAGEPGVVINTGSKQGITRPPGNYAYNLSKAGVLAYTESVAHALNVRENCRLTAHLLVPGFVYTPMISRHIPQKPPFAWTAGQTIEFALHRLDRGDFYIICPDGEATRAIDEKRMQWSADDIIQNRPALSRWHPEFKDAFEAYMGDD